VSPAPAHPLADVAYVQLTTFRRTGEPVRTPVWVAPAVDGSGRLVVITVDGNGKTKRLAHTPRVELRRCDVRGRVADDAPTYRGAGVVVRDPAQVAAVRAAVVTKYGWPARVSDLVQVVTDLLHVRRAARAGILLDVDPAPAERGPAGS
jgi:PPOX class probable F420-dependent enzyme